MVKLTYFLSMCPNVGGPTGGYPYCSKAIAISLFSDIYARKIILHADSLPCVTVDICPGGLF